MWETRKFLISSLPSLRSSILREKFTHTSTCMPCDDNVFFGRKGVRAMCDVRVRKERESLKLNAHFCLHNEILFWISNELTITITMRRFRLSLSRFFAFLYLALLHFFLCLFSCKQHIHSFVKPKSETITSAHRCKHTNIVWCAQLSSARRASYYILENCGLTLRHSVVYLTSIQHRHVRRAQLCCICDFTTLRFVYSHSHSQRSIQFVRGAHVHTCSFAHTRIQRCLRALDSHSRLVSASATPKRFHNIIQLT